MAGLKEIRRRIVSVKNTKQITRAMKLVSAAKLRRAQDAAVASRAYGVKLRDVITSVVLSLNQNFQHSLMRTSQGGKRRVIVIAGERGLCGAYNSNVMKLVQTQRQPEDEYVAVGRRAVAGLKRLGVNIVAVHEGLPEDPSRWPISEIATAAMQDFSNGACDEVVLIYTQFVSAISSQVTQEAVLPVSREVFVSHPSVASGRSSEEVERKYQSKFDVPPAELFDRLVPFAISAKIREAALEAKASEHASRMTAMDNATRNASDLIDRLRLFYNRARQSSITTELIDIVGGAEAVK